MAATFAHWKPRDEIFRSTNGGVNWIPLLDTDRMGPCRRALHPKPERRIGWATMEINPFNSNQVLFVTGYGIWSCTNATAADAGRPVHWTFLDNGLEETVPLALISPPEGAHLLSGVGDIDGFRHDDLDAIARAEEPSPVRVMAIRKTWPWREKTARHRSHRHRCAERTASSARPFPTTAEKPGRRLGQRTDQQRRRRHHCHFRRRQNHRVDAAPRCSQLFQRSRKSMAGLRRNFTPCPGCRRCRQSGAVLHLRRARRPAAGQHQ